MKQIRESIFMTFDGLSDTIDSTHIYIRAYSEDIVLGNNAEQLFIASLDAVKGITVWLRKNPLGKTNTADQGPCVLLLTFYRRNLQGFLSTGRIREKIRASDDNEDPRCSHKFEERIRVLLHIRVGNIDSNVSIIKDDVNMMKTTLEMSAMV